MKLPGHKADN